jgi:hypothetical protein
MQALSCVRCMVGTGERWLVNGPGWRRGIQDTLRNVVLVGPAACHVFKLSS